MGAKAASIFTVIALLCLMAVFPALRELWIVVIVKALPSFFTLGLSTVILYKAFRYPRGTAFTLLGLVQIGFMGWLLWLAIQASYIWLLIPILIAAILVGPRSAKATWKWLDVDRYYRHKPETAIED